MYTKCNRLHLSFPLRLALISAMILFMSLTQTKVASAAIYWGAYISGSTYGTSLGDAPWDTNTWDLFETNAGKKVSVLHWGQAWHWRAQSGYSGILDGFYQKFYPGDFDKVRQRGAIPFLDWGSWSLDNAGSVYQPAFSLNQIISGTYDSYIRQWAIDAKNWSHPFFLRFDWEMNGNWFPWSEKVNGNSSGQFVSAWKHVHNIFTSVGATNVTWVWCPNINYPGSIPLSILYPGDSYVDWVCIDGYNWGTNNPGHPDVWKSFYQVFKPTYDEVTALAPDKPLIIGETASSESGGSKAAWIKDMLAQAIPIHFPKINGFLWFNWNTDNSDWVIETSTAAREAFYFGISSPYYATNDFKNLNVVPIPRLSAKSNLNCRTNPVQLACFEVWRQSFTSGTYSTDADMNGSGTVTISDFEVWRRAYTSYKPSPSPTTHNPKPTTTLSPTPLPPTTPSPTRIPGTGLTCSTSSTLESLVSCITSHFGPFVIPSSTNQSDWKSVVLNMLNGQCDISATGTLSSVYQVRTFTDSSNGKNYCVAIEVKDSNPNDGLADNGWGTFIVNNTPSREVNQSAPHAVSDIATQDQAIGLFKSTNSRSFLMSGTRRSIGTSSCQSNLGYASSDASHNTDHFFFDATEILDAWYGSRLWWQIQWHGAAASTCPGVNVYISHGFSSAPATNYITVALKNNIKKYHSGWTVTVPGYIPSCSLNATTNVLGRFLNGVTPAQSCQTNASNYRHKFIHIEQQPGFRSAAYWHQAIMDTFP